MVDVFDNEPSLLDSIALKLDLANKPVGNWRSLARQLISTGQLLKEFEAQLHSSENPTALLFQYLRKIEKFTQLTVGELRKHLENMRRRDILIALDGVQGLYLCLYNNQINACTLIGQSTMVYCASKPMENSRVLRIIV